MILEYQYQITGETTVYTTTINYIDTENIDVYLIHVGDTYTQLNSTTITDVTGTAKSGLCYKYKNNSFNHAGNNEKITCVRSSRTLLGYYNNDTGYFEMKLNATSSVFKLSPVDYTVTENSSPVIDTPDFDIDLSIISTLTNCSLQDTSISGEYGDSKTILLNANSGYIFNESNIPTITINGTSNLFTLNSAKTQASYTLTINSDTTISSIVASAIIDTSFDIDLSGISTLTNCSLRDTSISGNYGDSKTIKINTVNNYFFSESNIPTITINDTSNLFTLNSAKTQASYTLTINSDTTISSIVASAVLFNYYKDLSAIANVDHCILSPSAINTPLNTDVTITLTANSNYYFSNTPTITINEYLVGWQSHDFTLNNDRTIATYVYHVAQYIADIEDIKAINGVAIPQTIISDKYGLITLYKPTSSILQSLPEIMLYYKGTDLIDLSQYITNFISMPLDIQTVGNKNITFNGVNTQVLCDYINDNIVTLDFGNCSITGFYNNSIDFNNCEVILYLPYLSNQKLDTNKVMNKTIHLVYKIDLFTGDFIAIIKIDNIIIYSFTGNMAIKIPYIIKTLQGKNASSYDGNSYSLIDDKQPKIIINENIKNNNLYVDTQNYCKLDILEGYNVVTNIEYTDNNITQTELELITNKLESGVIF